MLLVNDKVGLVFGGNGRIGKCVALELLSNGLKGVVIADLNYNIDYIEKWFGKDKIAFIKTDVTNLSDVRNVFDFALQKYGAIDIVINCAAVVNEISYASNITINLIGTTHIVNEAYNYLPKNKSSTAEQAVIVNLASVAGLTPLINFPIYSASKAGVIAFSYCMGKQKEMEGDFSVKIMTLCPGATETPMLDYGRNLCDTTTGEVQKSMIEIFKGKPPQEPESVAKCILHVIRHGANASCWLSADDKDAKLIDYDAILAMATSTFAD